MSDSILSNVSLRESTRSVPEGGFQRPTRSWQLESLAAGVCLFLQHKTWLVRELTHCFSWAVRKCEFHIMRLSPIHYNGTRLSLFSLPWRLWEIGSDCLEHCCKESRRKKDSTGGNVKINCRGPWWVLERETCVTSGPHLMKQCFLNLLKNHSRLQNTDFPDLGQSYWTWRNRCLETGILPMAQVIFTIR